MIYLCQKHFKELHYYCQNCKINIIESCLDELNKIHNISNFNFLWLNNDEIIQIDILFEEIEKKLNQLTK
jgi:hypothetical protein